MRRLSFVPLLVILGCWGERCVRGAPLRRNDEASLKGLALSLGRDVPCQDAAGKQLAKYLGDELSMNPEATPKVISIFGEAQWGTRALPRAVVRALYSVSTPAVTCINLQEIAHAVSSTGLAKAQRRLKDRVFEAVQRHGSQSVIVVEHAEAARGDSVRLLDAFLELFNGGRSHMEWNGQTVGAGGVIFFLLFESAAVVPKGGARDWREHLQHWLHHPGSEFTEEAFVGRLGAGIVVEEASCGAASARQSVCAGLADASLTRGLSRNFLVVCGVGLAVAATAFLFFSRGSTSSGSRSTSAKYARATARAGAPSSQQPPLGASAAAEAERIRGGGRTETAPGLRAPDVATAVTGTAAAAAAAQARQQQPVQEAAAPQAARRRSTRRKAGTAGPGAG